MRLLERLSDGAARLTRILVALGGAGLVIALALQVVSRYALGRAYPWTEELALFLFAWVVLLEASACVRAGAHVRLVLALELMPARLRAAWERALDAATLGFGLILLRSGWAYVDATLGQVSAAVRYPIEWLHLCAPVAGGLIALHALARLVAAPAAQAPGPAP